MADEIRAQPRNQLLGLLGAIQDEQFRADVGGGLRDVLNRGLLGGLLGMPVDLATMAMRPLGYKTENPVGGSEWIGQKMQDAGLVSAKRNPVGEALAGLVDPATMAAGAIKAVPLAAGMFIGKGAKTWDALQASKAMELEKAGTPARQIWSETGTWKGPDGMWRQEIPDNKAKFTEAKWTKQYPNAPEVDSAKLGDALSHGPAYEAYPSLKDADLVLNPNVKGASYYRPRPDLELGEYVQWKVDRGEELGRMRDFVRRMNDPTSVDHWKAQVREDQLGPFPAASTRAAVKEMRQYMKEKADQVGSMGRGMLNQSTSTPLHEIQHAIQYREGFARGGSPTGFPDGQVVQDAQLIRNLTDKGMTHSEAAAWFSNKLGRGPSNEVMDLSFHPDLAKMGSPEQSYRRLAGEAEARATQTRIPMDAAQRRATFPEDSYDVPMNALILRGLLAP